MPLRMAHNWSWVSQITAKKKQQKNNKKTKRKYGVSAIALNKKALRSINIGSHGEPLRNANPGRLRDKDRRLIHIKPDQRNEFISEGEDDKFMQTSRKKSV